MLTTFDRLRYEEERERRYRRGYWLLEKRYSIRRPGGISTYRCSACGVRVHTRMYPERCTCNDHEV